MPLSTRPTRPTRPTRSGALAAVREPDLSATYLTSAPPPPPGRS
jgi:hypothetical protein